MIKRAISEGAILVGVFFSIWFVLKQVDWMNLFKVEQKKDSIETKLGDMFVESIRQTETVVTHEPTNALVDSIISKICTSNEIDKSNFHVLVLEKDEINAFALPGGHIMVYSGLIKSSSNQQELASVLCHEIAHVQLNHVMQKLLKEVGLSVLISITTGNRGSETIASTARLLSSTAFDRQLESEADKTAVDYLLNANVDPEHFANFLMRFETGGNKSKILDYLSWMSTHPNSEDRAKKIIEYREGKKINPEMMVSQETWDSVVNEMNGN